MRDAVTLPSPGVVCIIYPPDVPACLIGIQVNGVADVEALLGTWTRGEPTFYDEFEPAHGNDGHTTADELAVELARYVDDNDDGVVYNGPELNAGPAARPGGRRRRVSQPRRAVAGAACAVAAHGLRAKMRRLLPSCRRG